MGAGIAKPERVAVRLCARDLGGAEAAATADPVLDHGLLAQALRKLLRHQPRHGVGAAAGRERHDEPDRPLRPARADGLRLCSGCRNERRQHGQDHTRHWSSRRCINRHPSNRHAKACLLDALGLTYQWQGAQASRRTHVEHARSTRR
jgi:hypothetical protein